MLNLFAPNTREGGLNLFLEAGNQFAIGGDQRLLEYDGLLRGDIKFCGVCVW